VGPRRFSNQGSFSSLVHQDDFAGCIHSRYRFVSVIMSFGL